MDSCHSCSIWWFTRRRLKNKMHCKNASCKWQTGKMTRWIIEWKMIDYSLWYAFRWTLSYWIRVRCDKKPGSKGLVFKSLCTSLSEVLRTGLCCKSRWELTKHVLSVHLIKLFPYARMALSIIWWSPFSQEGDTLPNCIFRYSVENKALGTPGELRRNSRYSQIFACAPASDLILPDNSFPHTGAKFNKLTITIFSRDRTFALLSD